jgi:hypothetical protein
MPDATPVLASAQNGGINHAPLLRRVWRQVQLEVNKNGSTQIV